MKFTSNIKAEPVSIIRARVAQIIFCVLILSASLIASSGEVQGRSIPPQKDWTDGWDVTDCHDCPA